MPADPTERAALDAFTLAIRVLCHAWDIDLPATEFERPWSLLREIADGTITLSSPAEMATRFPGMSDFLYDSAGQVIEHDRETARRVLKGLAGAF
jgi:hypothetical protein